MKNKELTIEELERILANPFYCLPDLFAPHEPLISEEQWIQCGVNAIKEMGAEKYLKHLLENLKGNYV